MSSFAEFREQVVKRFSYIKELEPKKIEADSIEDVYTKAVELFKIPLENIRFEVEKFKPRTVFQKSRYTVIAYPKMDFSFFDEDTQTMKNLNGEFFVRRGPGYVNLRVRRPELGGEAVSLDEVMNELYRLRGLTTEIREEEIETIVNEASDEWKIIAKFEYNQNNDADIQINISDNKMQAMILATPPAIGGADLSKKSIMSAIQSMDITNGVNDSFIERLEMKPIYNQWLEVASGKSPVNGNNAYIELVAAQEKTADTKYHKSQHSLTDSSSYSVKEGDVVARKVPYTHGEEGYDLFGNVIFPEVGSDITMTGNANVKISEDNTHAIALVSGTVYLKGLKVVVDQTWEIKGDLSTEIGNIDFPGSVIIRGNIYDDFVVKVGGNLTVMGSVGKSDLYIGGNLDVVNGINGRGSSSIEVKGNLRTKFLERVRAKIHEFCIVSESIINSDVICFNTILVLVGRGRVVNSRVVAEKEMYIKKVGTIMGEPSDLRVVSVPQEREKLEALNNKIKTLSSSIEKKRTFFGDTPINPDSYKKMTKSQQENLKKIIFELKKEQTEQKKLMLQAESIKTKIKKEEKNVSIFILESIMEETKISLNDESQILRRGYGPITFYLKNDKIVNRNLTDTKRLLDKFDLEKQFAYVRL